MSTPETVINFTHGVLVIKDGTTPTANEITVPLDQGKLRYTVARALSPVHNRKTLHSIVETKEVPMKVSFESAYQGWKSEAADEATPAEAIQGIEKASAWVGTDAARTNAYCVDLELTYTTAGSDQSEVLSIPRFAYESVDFSEGEEANLLTFSGMCRAVRPTSTRS